MTYILKEDKGYSFNSPLIYLKSQSQIHNTLAFHKHLNKRIFNRLLTSIFVKIILLTSHCYAQPLKKHIDGITTGVGEKGIYLGINKSLGKRNQIDLGFQQFKGNIASYGKGLVESVPVNYESQNIRFTYTRYLNNDYSSTGFYGQLGIDYSSIVASSTIDLSKQKYYLGNLEVTCNTCKDLIIEANNSKFQLVPSLSLGWQLMLNKNLSIKIGGGIQYFNLPNVTWRTNMENTPPKYVRDKIDTIENDFNNKLSKYPSILPTIFISSSYYF